MADEDEDVGGSNADPYSVLAANLGGPEKAALMLMKQRQAGVNAQQQKLMDMMQEQEGPLSQTGMSDYQKASMLFQAAGALAAPTKSRGLAGLMEGVGGAGTALAGPLSKADEAQRARQQQLQQLQLARQKLAMDMAGNQGVSPSDLMSLVKSTRENEEETPTPSEFDRILAQLSPEERKKALRAKAGLEPTDETTESASIPAEVRAAGPEAVKKYKEAYGSKVAAEMATAQTAADNMAAAVPILDRAEKAYQSLSKASAIGPTQATGIWRGAQGVVGAQSEITRQDFEAAAKELELLQAQIKMKGQGAITEGERRILQMTLPRLDAADPSTGLETLRMFRKQLEAAISKPERIRQRGADQTQPQGKIVDFGDLK